MSTTPVALPSPASTWMAMDRRRRTFLAVAAVFALASVLYALVTKYVWFGQQGAVAITDIGEAVAAGIAAAACAWAATQATGKDRRAWALISVSAGLWGAGEVVWSIYEVGLGVKVPYPSLADVGYLAAVPFAILGILSFWSPPRGTPEHWRVWFDGLIVALALTSTAWGFGLRTVYGSASSTKLLDLAYPGSDILIGTILILAIRRAGHQQKGRMALLLVGIAANSIADSAFSYLQAQGAYGAVGSVLDTGWFAGYLLIALAALYPPAPVPPEGAKQPLDLWQLALPWMTLLTASAGDVYSALSGHELDLFMSSLTATLAILLTVNMIIERREFLEMLTEIEESRATLAEEFRTSLRGIQNHSKVIGESERIEADEVRRLAAEINGTAERLDRVIDRML